MSRDNFFENVVECSRCRSWHIRYNATLKYWKCLLCDHRWGRPREQIQMNQAQKKMTIERDQYRDQDSDDA